MLKKTVPTSWIAAAHQSMQWGAIPSSARSPVGLVASGSMPVGALRVSWYCSALAAVKNNEPTKNVTATAVGVTWSK